MQTLVSTIPNTQISNHKKLTEKFAARNMIITMLAITTFALLGVALAANFYAFAATKVTIIGLFGGAAGSLLFGIFAAVLSKNANPFESHSRDYDSFSGVEVIRYNEINYPIMRTPLTDDSTARFAYLKMDGGQVCIVTDKGDVQELTNANLKAFARSKQLVTIDQFTLKLHDEVEDKLKRGLASDLAQENMPARYQLEGGNAHLYFTYGQKSCDVLIRQGCVKDVSVHRNEVRHYLTEHGPALKTFCGGVVYLRNSAETFHKTAFQNSLPHEFEVHRYDVPIITGHDQSFVESEANAILRAGDHSRVICSYKGGSRVVCLDNEQLSSSFIPTLSVDKVQPLLREGQTLLCATSGSNAYAVIDKTKSYDFNCTSVASANLFLTLENQVLTFSARVEKQLAEHIAQATLLPVNFKEAENGPMQKVSPPTAGTVKVYKSEANDQVIDDQSPHVIISNSGLEGYVSLTVKNSGGGSNDSKVFEVPHCFAESVRLEQNQHTLVMHPYKKEVYLVYRGEGDEVRMESLQQTRQAGLILREGIPSTFRASKLQDYISKISQEIQDGAPVGTACMGTNEEAQQLLQVKGESDAINTFVISTQENLTIHDFKVGEQTVAKVGEALIHIYHNEQGFHTFPLLESPWQEQLFHPDANSTYKVFVHLSDEFIPVGNPWKSLDATRDEDADDEVDSVRANSDTDDDWEDIGDMPLTESVRLTSVIDTRGPGPHVGLEDDISRLRIEESTSGPLYVVLKRLSSVEGGTQSIKTMTAPYHPLESIKLRRNTHTFAVDPQSKGVFLIYREKDDTHHRVSIQSDTAKGRGDLMLGAYSKSRLVTSIQATLDADIETPQMTVKKGDIDLNAPINSAFYTFQGGQVILKIKVENRAKANACLTYSCPKYEPELVDKQLGANCIYHNGRNFCHKVQTASNLTTTQNLIDSKYLFLLTDPYFKDLNQSVVREQ